MTENEEGEIECTPYYNIDLLRGHYRHLVGCPRNFGIYEAVLFPEVYHRYCHMLSGSRPYILEGKVEEDFGAISVTVDRIGFLNRYGKKGIINFI